MTIQSPIPYQELDADVVVVGAGMSGIACAYYLKTRTNLSFKVLERNDTIGGTWQLFKYPGIRTDSDLYTYTFSFQKARFNTLYGKARELLEYMDATIKDHKLEPFFEFNQHIMSASFSSQSNTWTLETASSQRVWKCRHLVFASGYYDCDQGFIPKYPGIEHYEGMFVHPQQYPEDLDLTNKRVAIIGSGATTVTMAPAIAKVTKMTTIIQRTPSYVLPVYNQVGFVNMLFDNFILQSLFTTETLVAAKRAYWGLIGYMFVMACFTFPSLVKKLYLMALTSMYGREDVNKHFTPPYNPWMQRMCMSPDADYYKAYSSNRMDFSTGHIFDFEKNAVIVQNKKTQELERIEADVVISATGLKVAIAGKIKISVDGKIVDPHEQGIYDSFMISNVPNSFIMLGYVHQSWTLRIELSCKKMCEILNHINDNGGRLNRVTAKPGAAVLDAKGGLFFDDLNSGYIQRARHVVPWKSSVKPWHGSTSYYEDVKSYLMGTYIGYHKLYLNYE